MELLKAVADEAKISEKFSKLFSGEKINKTEDAIIVNADQIFNLAMIQGPFVALLMIIPFGIFSFYTIDRQKHQKILTKLEVR